MGNVTFMQYCDNISNCHFFTNFEKNLGKRRTLKGFVNLYCKGRRQDKCVRKMVCNHFGNTLYVPKNMMPNGWALNGTTNHDWDQEIIEVFRKNKIHFFKTIIS